VDFYLGTHQPHWLRLLDVPLMVSRRTLSRYRTKPQARARWFRDSGGFTELQMHGQWTVGARTFVAEARADARDVGLMEYCAPRDWMCEPLILRGGTANGIHFAGTHKSIAEHQALTVADYLDLLDRAPELPWVPVLQGWDLDDYLRCLELYDRAGVDLAALPRVGVGTICRRQGTDEAARILARLESEGLRLHAFGLKGTGIPNVAPFLASSDSLAWSFAARRQPPMEGCTTHKNCANCQKFALRWLDGIMDSIARHSPRPYQEMMTL